MINRLYNWTLSLAEHPRALWALAFVAFIESSFFPIPPDIMLIPMILAARSQAFRIALVAVVASVAGGLFGYALGAFAFDSIGQPILAALGKDGSILAFNEKYNAYGPWAVLIAGVTPFPFKVITIMSGWTGMALVPFVLSALVARAIRFFAVGLAAVLLRPSNPQLYRKAFGLGLYRFYPHIGRRLFCSQIPLNEAALCCHNHPATWHILQPQVRVCFWRVLTCFRPSAMRHARCVFGKDTPMRWP
jgi:membrane protein YqaA with SNARE-associated domain